MSRKFLHLDANESVFFQRELEFVKSKSYDVQYPELKARSLIPVSFEAGPGAETITYEQYDQVGMAKIVSSYADDLPRADIKGKEFTSRVRSLADSYGYNIQEIRAAKMAGKPLEQRKSNAAKRAMMQKEDAIAALGDAGHGLLGLVNHPNISSTTLPADGTGASTLWANKTPVQILRDLNKVANFIVENTKEVEMPNTLLMPVEKYNYISSTPIGDNADKTILKFFLENSSYIKEVIPWNKLKAAGAGGLDRMIAYDKNPEKLTLEIPQDFEQLDVEQRGLEFLVPCHSRCGGVIIYYPLSVAYADGL